MRNLRMRRLATGSMLCAVSLVGLAGCVNMFVSTDVPQTVIESCVRASGYPEGTQINVEEVFRTDGMNRRVIRSADISADEARKINRCIEARVMGTGSLPDVAGVSQRTETVRTATGSQVTYTYGTPPAAEGSTASPGIGQQCARRGAVLQGGSGYC